MKVMRTITINSEIAEQLAKEKNYSKLINDILEDYYAFGGNIKKIEELTSEINKKEKTISDENQKLEVLRVKLEEAMRKEDKIKETLGDIPKNIIEDFKAFPLMNEEVLRDRNKDIYKIDEKKLLEAWKTFKDEN